MNRILTAVLLSAMAAALSVGAFAASKSTTVEIFNPTQINGTTLKPGRYKVEYKTPDSATAGQSVEVTFKLDGKQVATVTGQVKQLSKAPQSTEVTTENVGGAPAISEIDFGGSTAGIVFSSESMQAGQ